MKKYQRNTLILLAAVLPALGIGGYLVYASRYHSPASTAAKGSAIKCDTNQCFQEKFIKCEPASLQQKAVTPDGSNAYFEIVGGDTANCTMLYRTDKDNKDLICTYSNTGLLDTGNDYEFAVVAAKNENDILFGKETNCTGSKVEKLKKI